MLDQLIKPVCVAHSFGSETGVRIATDALHLVSQLILVDSVIGSHDGTVHAPRQQKFYDRRADAIARYSTIPRESYGAPFIRYEVARRSVRQVREDEGEGWTWWADPNVMSKLTFQSAFDRLGHASCSIDLIYGTLSSIGGPELRMKQVQAIGGASNVVAVDDAGHHIPLDQPIRLAETIYKLINKRY
jgi:pimeloyl-ACP methyl ester carboxylesterase